MNQKQKRKIYLKTYWKSDRGKASLRRYRKSRKGKIARKRYDQSEKGKINHHKGNIRHFILYPERMKARSAVNNAVKLGKLPCPNTMQCYYGNHPATQYHHYKGYKPKFWLKVIPVCVKCHQERRIA